MNVERRAVSKRSDVDEVCNAENRQEHWEIQDNREEDLQGGEISDGEHLGRGLIAPGGVRVGLHLSCGGPAGVWRPPRADGDLACRVAFAEERPERHHPSCSLESLCQTRDEDRVPAGLRESIVRSQRGLEHRLADRQHLLAVGVQTLSGMLWCGLPLPGRLRAGPSVSEGDLRLRRGVSQQVREVWQTLPVDLS